MFFDLQRFADALRSNTMRFGTDGFILANGTDTVSGGDDTVSGGDDTVSGGDDTVSGGDDTVSGGGVSGTARIYFRLGGKNYYVQLTEETSL